MHQFLTVVAPTSGTVYDLTTVEEVNEEFSLTSSTANDAEVATQITAASKIVADMCGRVFASQTVTETFRLRWADHRFEALNLSRYPVTEFTSLTVGGVEADAATYELDYDAGLLYRIRHGWPCSSLIVATYTGGYSLPDDAPSGLARACLEIIKEQRFAQGRNTAVREVWAGENRVAYFDRATSNAFSTGANSTIGMLIDPFKRLAV